MNGILWRAYCLGYNQEIQTRGVRITSREVARGSRKGKRVSSILKEPKKYRKGKGNSGREKNIHYSKKGWSERRS